MPRPITAADHMAEAALSVELARTSPNRRIKRLWLEQASEEMDRAHALRVAAKVARIEAGPICN